MSQVILVDNAAYSYAFQLGNGVPIIPYYRGKSDYELLALEKYLLKMESSIDMREQNEANFKLSEYHHYFSKPENFIEDLYINSRNE